MRFQFSNTLLTPSTLENASATKINGQQVIDEAGFIRAVAQTLFARGNKSTVVSFSVTRLFSTRREASLFLLMHWASLPKQGDLHITVGDESDEAIAVLRDAAADQPEFTQRGLAVDVRYTFRGGVFESEDAIGEDLDGDDLVKRGFLLLDQGDESKAVAFETEFAAAPTYPNAIIEAPAGQPPVSVVGCTGVGPGGFTVLFAGAIPAAGYKLRWQARL